MERSKAPSLLIKAPYFCRPTELRGGQRTKFVGGRKAAENFVRRFPVEKSREAGKGECISDARQGGCMVFAAKGGIRNGAEGAVPRQRARSANQ